MKQVIVAGATGYLGKHIILTLKAQNIPFKAIARNPEKLKHLGLEPNQVITAEVTKPETLKGIFSSTDYVISTVGITRQKDGLTYKEVDFQANKNLLIEAKASNVSKFIYVSVINGNSMRHLKIIEAKEQFVDLLVASKLNYTVVRPNGFFSDLSDFLDMAKRGKVFLFGKGEFKLNPIDGSDLAQAIIDHAEANHSELNIGGPDILTQNEIALLAFKTLNKAPKIIHVPNWVRVLVVNVLRTFTSSKFYGPIEFFLTMMAQDNIAPRYGVNRVENHFKKVVDKVHE